jgi:thiol-disulfide isomerase/thioredoxin
MSELSNITGQLDSDHFSIDNQGVSINGVSNIKRPGILLIYENWCGHCVRFKPIYDQFSQLMNQGYPKKNKVLCYAIEGKIMSEDLKSKVGVQGFPTIVLFNSDGYITQKYAGNRDIDSLKTAVGQMS